MNSRYSKIIEYSQIITNEVEDSVSGSGETREMAFLDIAASKLVQLGIIDGFEPVYSEKKFSSGKNGKIYGYDFDEEAQKLDLFFIHYYHGKKLNKTNNVELQKYVDLVRNYYEECITSYPPLFKILNARSHERMAAHDIFKSAKVITKIRIFVLSNTTVDLQTVKNKEFEIDKIYTGQKAHHLNISVGSTSEFFGINRLYDLEVSSSSSDNLIIDFENDYEQEISCLKLKGESKDVTCYLASIPGQILYHLYEEFGSRILEKNVRSFLQATGKVNKGILNTLKDEPDKFMAYNNGISIVADKIDIKKNANGDRILSKAENFQIVNGGQTSASIHNAVNNKNIEVSYDDLFHVYVPAKITLINAKDKDKHIGKIALYANTQNKVKESDFSANHPLHKKITEISKTTFISGDRGRWYFERKSGSYQIEKKNAFSLKTSKKQFMHDTPPNRKITKEYLSKCWLSWNQFPASVSKGEQWAFIDFMNNYGKSLLEKFDQKHFKQMIAVAILTKQATEISKEDRDRIPGYWNNIVTYIVSLMSFKTQRKLSLDMIWENQKISSEMESLIHSWSLTMYNFLLKTAEGTNVTQWCKKPKCWDVVKNNHAKFTVPKNNIPAEMGGVLISRIKKKRRH